MARKAGKSVKRPPHGSEPILPSVNPAVGSGVDFANYERNTLHRRMARRMVLYRLDGIPDYVRVLQGDPAAVEALKTTVFPVERRTLQERFARLPPKS